MPGNHPEPPIQDFILIFSRLNRPSSLRPKDANNFKRKAKFLSLQKQSTYTNKENHPDFSPLIGQGGIMPLVQVGKKDGAFGLVQPGLYDKPWLTFRSTVIIMSIDRAKHPHVH